MPTSSLINVAGHRYYGSKMMNMAGLLFSHAAKKLRTVTSCASLRAARKEGHAEKGEGREWFLRESLMASKPSPQANQYERENIPLKTSLLRMLLDTNPLNVHATKRPGKYRGNERGIGELEAFGFACLLPCLGPLKRTE
jgi:hypothetical protein